jgi:hypothetical protein
MSFTKKVKIVSCKILIIIFLVNLLLTLINESLITCQSINANHNLFVYTTLDQFHNIWDIGCSNVLYKECENCKGLAIPYIFIVSLLLTLSNEPLITCQSLNSNHNIFVYTSLSICQ